MMKNILYRKGIDEEGEYSTAAEYCNLFSYRTQLPSNSIIWGRYSVLPFYKELEEELKLKGSKLINSYQQHMYVADIENWYQDLSHITPETWFLWGDLPEDKYIVKGRTNSRKHEWKHRMFAENREQMISIVKSLLDDSLISEQGLCIRKYIPLKTYDYGINDLPITNEWRFFFYGETILSYGYYWSSFYDKAPSEIEEQGIKVAMEAAKIASNYINFFVVDVAQTETGEWIVIELNDGQMSGLSCNKPDELYKNISLT